MIDSHTHSNHSPDSSSRAEDMIKEAIRLNVKYYAITDHCDYDFDYCTNTNFSLPALDIDNHIKTINLLKNKYRSVIDIACGIEVGYSRESESAYKKLIDTYPLDVIINSVHTVYNEDCYQKNYFENKTQHEAYEYYFKCVLNSIYASYDYDIIGHLGYVIRKAPYKKRLFDFIEYKNILSDILKAIIEKGKTLEVNTHIHINETPILPSLELLEQYKKMGGKKITFSSDAHYPTRICEKYEDTILALKNIGFDYLTYYKNREEFKYKI